MSLIRRYHWTDRTYGPQVNCTALGDRLHWASHFPGVSCWSIDVFTRRGALCLHFGRPVWRPNNPPRREPGVSVSVHAGRFLFGFRTGRGVDRFRQWAEINAA